MNNGQIARDIADEAHAEWERLERDLPEGDTIRTTDRLIFEHTMKANLHSERRMNDAINAAVEKLIGEIRSRPLLALSPRQKAQVAVGGTGAGGVIVGLAHALQALV